MVNQWLNLLLKENCTVTIVHSKTKNLKKECLKADILVVAVGVLILLKDWVKEGSIIIDVGINKVKNKIVGDVDFDDVKRKSQSYNSGAWWRRTNDDSLLIKKYS